MCCERFVLYERHQSTVQGESIALKNVQVHVMEGGEVQLEMDQDTLLFVIPLKPKVLMDKRMAFLSK